MKVFKNKGLTLIGLLLIIAVVSFLLYSIIFFIDPKNQIERTQALKIVNDFNIINAAFQQTSIDGINKKTYPLETDFGSVRNPSIKSLVENNYLKHVEKNINPDLAPYAYYVYDNDGDYGTGLWNGVNILIFNVISEDISLAKKIDKILDHSDGLDTGRFRANSSIWGFSMYNNL